MQKNLIEPWCPAPPGPETNTDSPGPFFMRYTCAMGLEGGRRRKEKPKKSILKTITGDAILAAGVLAAAHVAHGVHKAEKLKEEKQLIAQSEGEVYEREQSKLPSRFKNFRRSSNIIDRRHETAAQSEQPIDEFTELASREMQDREHSLRQSEIAKQLDGRTMPRHTHSVKTWHKKNQIDHAIKRVQRDVLGVPLPKPHPHKKKEG